MRSAVILGLACAIALRAHAAGGVIQDAIVLFDAGEIHDAIPLLEAVANDRSETPARRAKADLYLGLSQAALGDPDAAAGFFHRAFRLDANLTLPSSVTPGAQALANQARSQLGLAPLGQIDAAPPTESPPPPADEQDPLAAMGKARAELHRLQAELETLRSQSAAAEELDRSSARVEAAQAQLDSGTPAVTSPSPPAKPVSDPVRLLVGVDVLDIGFLGTAQASPTPEVEFGWGNDSSELGLLFGLMLGDQIGYAGKLRLALLGTPADPVGWNWSADLGFVVLPGPDSTTYLDASTSPINITWKVAPKLILEARVIGVGYYGAVSGIGPSSWSLEGGLGVRWLL